MVQKKEVVPDTKRTEKLINKIWNEMYDAKKEEIYLAYYLRSLRTKRKRLNMGMIFVSFAGLVLEKWVNDSSFVTLSLLLAAQLLKDVIPVIAVDEKLIDRLPEYRNLQTQKFELLNRLYYDFAECNSMSEIEAKDEYFKIRELNKRIDDMDNSLHLPVKQKLFKSAEASTHIYMNNFFRFDEEA